METKIPKDYPPQHEIDREKLFIYSLVAVFCAAVGLVFDFIYIVSADHPLWIALVAIPCLLVAIAFGHWRKHPAVLFYWGSLIILLIIMGFECNLWG